LKNERFREVFRVNPNVGAAITQRRAIRAYKPDMVPGEVVRDLLAEARWAPSATNTQSTFVHVLSGAPLATFKANLREYAESEAPPSPDLGPGLPLPPLYLARQQELFQTRMSFVAAEEARIGVQPPAQPVDPMVAGAAIFGAPVVLVLAYDKELFLPYACFDAGLFAMAITLSAEARGLGTCITGSNVRYPDLLRKVIPGTENQNFVVAISLGYPIAEAPINRFPRTRLPVDEFVRFVR
jgi:nitroreductase